MKQIIEYFYENIDHVLLQLEKEIIALKAISFPETRKKACDSVEDAGVYLLYFKGDIIYVGETKAFNSRLNDHTYDSKIFKTAKTHSGLNDRNEIRKWMSDKFAYKFLPLSFGRLELEMFLIENLQAKNHKLWNKEAYRKSWLSR